MKRIATSFCVAAAFGCMATLGAQTPTTSTTPGQRAPMADKAGDVTVTGCLSKSADGKFSLTNARVDNPMASAGTSTTTGTTAGAPTSTTTSSPTSASHDAAMSWMLAGGTDLDKHVGHKIQVTGRSNWNSAMDRSRTPDPTSTTSTAGTTTGTTGTTATAAAEGRKDMSDAPRLDVQSIKMIAPSCS